MHDKYLRYWTSTKETYLLMVSVLELLRGPLGYGHVTYK